LVKLYELIDGDSPEKKWDPLDALSMSSEIPGSSKESKRLPINVA